MKRLVAFILLLTAICSFNTTLAQAQDQGAMPNPGPSLLLFYHNGCAPCKDILRSALIYNNTKTGIKFPLIVIHTRAAPLPKWIIEAFKDGRIKKEATFPILIKWDGEKQIDCAFCVLP